MKKNLIIANVTIADMKLSRNINRYATWIAFFAIVLASLAPSISHVIAAKKAGMTVMYEICTVNGIRSFVQPQSSQEHHAPTEKTMSMEHCPFCLTGAVSFALLPATFSLPVMSGNHILPALFYESSHPLFAWVSAQPRGPPTLS